jgi:hypothetical protein
VGRAICVTFRALWGFQDEPIVTVMKTILVLATAVAFAALALSSLSFESATSALFAAGFAALVLSDYSGQGRVLARQAVLARGQERLGLAA